MIAMLNFDGSVKKEFHSTMGCAKHIVRFGYSKTKSVWAVQCNISDAIKKSRKAYKHRFVRNAELPIHTHSEIELKICQYLFSEKKRENVNLPFWIKSVVASYSKLNVDDEKFNNSRSNSYRNDETPQIKYCRLRQIAMYLIKKDCPEITLEKIGEMFRGKDHSTVINSIRKVQDDIFVKNDFVLDVIKYAEVNLRKIPNDTYQL